MPLRFSLRSAVFVLSLLVFCTLAAAGSAARAQGVQPAPAGAQRTGQMQQQPLQGSAPAIPERFRLNAQQQHQLGVVLMAWQHRSSQVQTLSCKFTMWQYDPVWGPPTTHKTFSTGEVKFASPDRGYYRITEISEFKPIAVRPPQQTDANQGTYEKSGEQGEHWICDGKSIFEFRYDSKQLVERRLPPELQGKAITDGPLPFVFGVTAAKLQQRYLLRLMPAPPNVQGQIWLEALPKWQQDAANFQRVEVILSEDSMLPFALQLYLPNGKNRTVYQFSDVDVNNPLHRLANFLNSFVAPRTPLGWQHRIEEAPVAQHPAGPTPPPGHAQPALGSNPAQTVPR